MANRHVVLAKFKEGGADIVCQKFDRLASIVDEVKKYERGTNNTKYVGQSGGFTHMFLMEFDSEADKEKYGAHEEHQKFLSEAGPYVEDRLIFDYPISRPTSK